MLGRHGDFVGLITDGGCHDGMVGVNSRYAQCSSRTPTIDDRLAPVSLLILIDNAASYQTETAPLPGGTEPAPSNRPCCICSVISTRRPDGQDRLVTFPATCSMACTMACRSFLSTGAGPPHMPPSWPLPRTINFEANIEEPSRSKVAYEYMSST